MKRAILVLTAMALVACGPRTSDKSGPPDDNASTNSDTNNATANGSTNNATDSNNGPGNNSNNQTPGNNSTNNSTIPDNNSTNNATSNNPTNNSTNNSTGNNSTNNSTNNQTDCSIDETFTGQINGDDDHGGGTVTMGNLSVDSGLDDVIAEVPSEPDDPATITDEGTAIVTPPLPVDGAIVTATSFGPVGNSRFWIQDANTATQLFLDIAVPVTVKVGMEVSFDVLEVQNFEGHHQITSISGFTVLSEDNPVPLREVTNRTAESNDYGRIVRMGGEVIGPPVDCGGVDCWELEYPGGTITFRSRSLLIEDGSCLTFVGPLYSFPGPRQSAATPNLQLDTINFDWMLVDL